MVFDIRLKENFKLYISGPSASGKTTFVGHLLEHVSNFAKRPPNKVIYYYVRYQAKFDEMLKKGLVDKFVLHNSDILDQLDQELGPVLAIFDDMILSPHLAQVAELYTVIARHSNISLIFLTQKLFSNNEHFRQISQNSDYFCLFKNPRNSSEVRALSQQMTPGSNELFYIYNKATADPYSYLFINLTQECIPQIKYLSHLFKESEPVRTYITTNCD